MSGAGPEEVQEEPRRRGEGSGVTVQQLGWSVLHFMSLRWPSRVARASVSLTVKPMILQASLPFFFLVQNAIEPWLKGAKGTYATRRQRVTG